MDPGLADFDESRPRLFGIAYRMLGSVAEAEDVVQDAWLRWQQTDRSVVENPAGFLTTVTTRLAINVADSARRRREVYVGPWLPEPVDTSADPALGAENGEALEAAVLVLLERLPARERAAYVLREAFDYPYPRVAEILEISEANTRQVVTRARQHVAEHRSAPVDRAEHRRLLEAFVSAARGGDLGALERLLAAGVVSTSDGAGVTRNAARVPIVGRSKVARVLAAFRDRFWTGSTITWLETNGRPSLLVRHGDEPAAVLSIEAGTDGIEQLLWVMAPDKLSQIGRLPGQH
ncbi:RNA polymerase sigma-70 factor [Nocardioides lianchengensis]|uniref:RNA polymerase sigma-70 factor, ECF subfamily n=1 Tax=Nocardioides lianchengensis TaxID=1045774 RepID=A0A1G6PN90_9ACTN|nr:RNA polymerase sigma-70 factor [Nocardioides lianchengensis]NYG11919.1 RNA polymerase sigma-70 factor (ECF subfamily) [Nocardioides lianchengensis]SDC81670.1 RNA polymerase sigma-70 factor, ECF subfamily [Nocardioides lianchengensis]